MPVIIEQCKHSVIARAISKNFFGIRVFRREAGEAGEAEGSITLPDWVSKSDLGFTGQKTAVKRVKRIVQTSMKGFTKKNTGEAAGEAQND
jgi:hypothetical protein